MKMCRCISVSVYWFAQLLCVLAYVNLVYSRTYGHTLITDQWHDQQHPLPFLYLSSTHFSYYLNSFVFVCVGRGNGWGHGGSKSLFYCYIVCKIPKFIWFSTFFFYMRIFSLFKVGPFVLNSYVAMFNLSIFKPFYQI